MRARCKGTYRMSSTRRSGSWSDGAQNERVNSAVREYRLPRREQVLRPVEVRERAASRLDDHRQCSKVPRPARKLHTKLCLTFGDHQRSVRCWRKGTSTLFDQRTELFSARRPEGFDRRATNPARSTKVCSRGDAELAERVPSGLAPSPAVRTGPPSASCRWGRGDSHDERSVVRQGDERAPRLAALDKAACPVDRIHNPQPRPVVRQSGLLAQESVIWPLSCDEVEEGMLDSKVGLGHR